MTIAEKRDALIADFLARNGWGAAERRLLAGDASFRRYDRLVRSGESAVLMDAPPPHEDVRCFERIDRLLLDLGLSAPRPFGMDADAGLLLLEDLGDRTFTRALAAGDDEASLYRLAVDLLIALHRRCAHESRHAFLPAYDDRRLLDEALLFTDWYLPAITGEEVTQERRQAYVAAWEAVLPVARRVPESLVLRDYHVDNLMVLADREGVAACGLLDFQDAVIGPVSYDLVSLLEDARRDVSSAVVEAALERYLSAFPDLEAERFLASYAVLGAQRNAKIIGIFSRLCRRDGKPQYLQHIPRVWRLLEADLAHAALAPVRAWLDETVPPSCRRAPRPEAGP